MSSLIPVPENGPAWVLTLQCGHVVAHAGPGVKLERALAAYCLACDQFSIVTFRSPA